MSKKLFLIPLVLILLLSGCGTPSKEAVEEAMEDFFDEVGVELDSESTNQHINMVEYEYSANDGDIEYRVNLVILSDEASKDGFYDIVEEELSNSAYGFCTKGRIAFTVKKFDDWTPTKMSEDEMQAFFEFGDELGCEAKYVSSK